MDKSILFLSLDLLKNSLLGKQELSADTQLFVRSPINDKVAAEFSRRMVPWLYLPFTCQVRL